MLMLRMNLNLCIVSSERKQFFISENGPETFFFARIQFLKAFNRDYFMM